MVVPYDHQNEDHEYSLQMMYTKVFGKEPDLTEVNSRGVTMTCEEWKDIGF